MTEFVCQKKDGVFLPFSGNSVGGNWFLPLVLSFLLVGELCLPVKGQAQSFSETGNFYFTGSHRPLQSGRTQFREFMGGDGLKVGPVQLHPFFGVAEVFTDNVFRRKTDRKSDFLTTLAPGLQALLPFGGGKHSVVLDYRATQFLYNKFSENNALAQDAQGHVSLNFPGGLSVDVQGGYLQGFDPRGSELDTQQLDITKWNLTTVLGQVEYSGKKGGIRFRSAMINLHYTNNGQAPVRDRTRIRSDVTVFANVTRSTSALLGVRIETNDFDKNTQLNNFGYGVFTGFRLAPTRQFSGEFNIGYNILNFDRAPIPEDQPVTPGLSRGSKQRTAVFMQGNLHWNPTSRLSFHATPYRIIQQSAVFNTGTFIRTGVNISGNKVLTQRLALRGVFNYQNIDYDSGRVDDQFRWRIGPAYRAVNWLGFRLDYIFDKRDSSQNNFNYYANTIMFSVEGIL